MKGFKSVAVYVFLFLMSVSALGMLSYKNQKASYLRQDEPVSSAKFKQITASTEKPVLVYFSASWCAVCKKVTPLVDEIKSEYGGGLEVLKIDTDRDKALAEEMEIDALPVLMMYSKGVRQWIHVGIIDKGKLKSQIGK